MNIPLGHVDKNLFKIVCTDISQKIIFNQRQRNTPKSLNMNKQTVNLNLQPAKSQFQNCSPFQVSLVFSFPRHFLGCWGSTPVGRIDFQLHVAIGKLHNGRLIGHLRRWEWWVFASVCVLLPGVEPIKALVCGLKVCCLLDGHG